MRQLRCAAIGEAGEFEELGDPSRERRAVDPEVSAVHLKVLGHREIGIQVVELRDHPNTNPRPSRRLRYRLADHLDLSAVGIDEPETAAERRRLARAVRPEEAEAFAAADLERKPADDFVVAIELAKSLDAQHDVRMGVARIAHLSSARGIRHREPPRGRATSR